MADREGGKEGREAPVSKFVAKDNATPLLGWLQETDKTSDGRTGVYGYRDRDVANQGTGVGIDESNGAVLGHNFRGNHLEAFHGLLSDPDAIGPHPVPIAENEERFRGEVEPRKRKHSRRHRKNKQQRRRDTDVEFSHGICPRCMRKLYPEFSELDKNTPDDADE